MKKILLVTLLLVSTLLSAQNLQTGYISFADAYKFNFPVQGISMSMPSKMGFLLPKLGTHGFLDMDKDVNLFLPQEALNSKLEYKFSILSNNKSMMSLFVFRPKSFFGNTYLERIRAKYPSLEKISSLENDLGTSISYRCEVKGRLVESHVFYSEGILYHFIMSKNVSAKDMYLSIIRSVRKNNFTKELEKYEEHKKKSYLKKEEKKQDVKDTAHDPKLRRIKGENPIDWTLNYKQEGVKFWLPQNNVYDINARDLREEENGEVEVYRAESDKKESFLFSRFDGANGTIIYRSKFKNPDNPNEEDFSNIGKSNKGSYTYYKEFNIVVDGIKCNASFAGSSYWGNLELWFETEVAYFSVSLFNVNKENIDFYDKWLSSMKIQSSAKRVKYNSEKPLSSVLILEDKPKVTLDKLNISNALSPSLGGFRCNLSTIGMGVYLPGKMSDYNYGIDANWGKDTLKLGAKGETNLAPEVFYVTIRSLYQGYKADLTLYLNEGKRFLVRQQIEDAYLHRKGVTASNFDPYKSAGVFTARDGSEWGILIEESGTKALILGGNDVYNIYYTIAAKTPQQLDAILALTHEFTIDKQNPKKK